MLTTLRYVDIDLFIISGLSKSMKYSAKTIMLLLSISNNIPGGIISNDRAESIKLNAFPTPLFGIIHTTGCSNGCDVFFIEHEDK